MAPIMLATELLQVLPQESTHFDYPVSHTFDLTKPLLVQAGVVQNS